MLNTELIVSTLVDDDVESLICLLSNVNDHTFRINNDKYKYPQFLLDSQGAPLLSIAAYFGSFKCFQYLSDTETHIPSFKYSILSYACAGGNMNIIHDVFSRFPEIFTLNYSPTSHIYCFPGYQAIYHGNLDVVKWLFLKGYSFNKDELCEACFSGYIEIVDFLINNITECSKSESTYFEMMKSSCKGGNEKIVQLLLTKFPFKKINKKKYQILLNLSCENGNISCLKCLLFNSKKLFPRLASSFIQSTLSYASQYEYLDIINYLIRQGGEINDTDSQNSPIKLSLISGSYSTAKFYLERMHSISDDKIHSFFELIFSVNYSISIIQLLLEYMHKTLNDFKEEFAKLAVENNVSEFFDDLIKNEISLNFLKIELFDSCPQKFELFIKLYDSGAPFKFDVHNKVFLEALKTGNYSFVNYSIQKGAILNDKIIQISECLKTCTPFYRCEYLIQLLFKYNIDLTQFPLFLKFLIESCGNKRLVYELYGLKALQYGAIVTKDVFKDIIRIKWYEVFQKVVEKEYFEVDVDDISLNECKINKELYKRILQTIFNRQPSILNQLVMKIDKQNIKTNIAEFVKSISSEKITFFNDNCCLDEVPSKYFDSDLSFSDFELYS